MAFQAPAQNEVFHISGDAGILQFDVQQAFPAELIEHLIEERNGFTATGIEASQIVVCQVRYTAPAVGCAIDRLVMNNNDPAIGTPADIELYASGAGVQRFTE